MQEKQSPTNANDRNFKELKLDFKVYHSAAFSKRSNPGIDKIDQK